MFLSNKLHSAHQSQTHPRFPLHLLNDIYLSVLKVWLQKMAALGQPGCQKTKQTLNAWNRNK